MNEHDGKLIEILMYMRALCGFRGGGTKNQLLIIANNALDNNYWSEAFRIILYDGASVSDTKHAIESHLVELGIHPSADDREESVRLEIAYNLRQLLADQADVLQIAHYILLQLYRSELYNDPDFFNLRAFQATYDQWWVCDSDWMQGIQLEEARQSAINRLKLEARRWLDKHGVSNPFEGL